VFLAKNKLKDNNILHKGHIYLWVQMVLGKYGVLSGLVTKNISKQMFDLQTFVSHSSVADILIVVHWIKNTLNTFKYVSSLHKHQNLTKHKISQNLVKLVESKIKKITKTASFSKLFFVI